MIGPWAKAAKPLVKGHYGQPSDGDAPSDRRVDDMLPTYKAERSLVEVGYALTRWTKGGRDAHAGDGDRQRSEFDQRRLLALVAKDADPREDGSKYDGEAADRRVGAKRQRAALDLHVERPAQEAFL